MSPLEKLDFLMRQNINLKTKITITLSRERLNANDVSYQRPSVPINSDFGLLKIKERKTIHNSSAQQPPEGLFDITN